MTSLYTITSVILVSLVSLIGVAFLGLGDKFLKKALLYLVSFSAGALLGDTFIHILPEALKEGSFTVAAALAILSGMVLFFILEKFVFWHHCHKDTTGSCHPFVYMNLVGDGLHNFIDGAIIAASYLASIKLGVVTTIAVLIHEIPQEIGDFGVLIHGGFSKAKALLMNLLSGLAALIGAVLVLFVSTRFDNVINVLLLFTSGGFIYIASADLIPEIHKSEGGIYRSIGELAFFILGIMTMLFLLKIG
jgi:zinc and cadmium transporter